MSIEPLGKPVGTVRYYPNYNDNRKLHDDFRVAYQNIYSLQDQIRELKDTIAAMSRKAASPTNGNGKPSGPPPGSGPADSMLLGLRVAPVDTQTLADGTKLTYKKSAGHFEFM